MVMKAQQSPLRRLTAVFGKIATAVVSGLPKRKLLFRPVNKSLVHLGKTSVKPDNAKHYHKPIAKPVVEKQTLLKEKKKVRSVH